MPPLVKRKDRRGDKLLADYTIEVVLRGTEKPYARIKPGYNSDLGPHICIVRIGIDGEEHDPIIFGTGGTLSLIRWLPLVMNAAKRLEQRARAESQQQA